MIEDKVQQLQKEFSQLSSWEDRYKRIIQIGKALDDIPDQFRDPKFLIKGCQSQVWLHAEMQGQKMKVYADSDALIVKGLVGLLLRIYDEEEPSEILKNPPDFLTELGLSEHLSPSRANGFQAMLKQIFLYATAFRALASSH